MAFQLKQNRKESENKTIRFPLPLIQEIESVIANQDVTFSSFVLQACEYALKNMDTDENKSEWLYLKSNTYHEKIPKPFIYG